MIITTAKVSANISDVTPEQIGRCRKFIASTGNYYLVENEHDERDQAGEIIEYKVTYDKEHGFTCSCKSGANGFANVKHASGVCKHVRWSVAAAMEERAALAELATKEDKGYGEVAGHIMSHEEYTKLMSRKPLETSERGTLTSSAPFHLLK